MTKPIKTDIRLEIVGTDIVIDSADIEVQIKKTSEKEPNYCTCTVYNMSDDTFEKIRDKAYHVNVYADIDGSGFSLVFTGDLRDLKKWKKPPKPTKTGKKRKSTAVAKYNSPAVRIEDDGPNVKTIIELQDGLKTQFLDFHYSIGYEGRISNIDILNDCIKRLKQGNVGVGHIDTPSEFIFTNGKSFSGSIYNLMTQMANIGGCNLTIQNGVVSCIRVGGKNLDYIYVLDGTYCSRPEEDTNKEVNIEAPVLPNLNPDNIIMLDFQNISGLYKVLKFDMTINNFGGSGQGTKIVSKRV